NPPDGYIFVCPQEDLQSSPSVFQWPDFPAYWSLDPSGIERLSMQEALELGFPGINLTTEVLGHSWDDQVYEGVRQFYHAKGFDPDSQNVAWYLRYPLYHL
ncbi:hypothetical protein DFH09DRAFT_882397, partial [Mycena vulgaris]